MTHEVPGPNVESVDQTLGEIDGLIDEIAGLAGSDLAEDEFYSGVLDRVVNALSAEGGIVWVGGRQKAPEPRCRVYPPVAAQESIRNEPIRGRTVAWVLESGGPRLVPPGTHGPNEGAPSNPTPFLVALCPWREEDGPTGVIEVFLRPGASPKAQQGYLRFLGVVADLVAEHQRNRQLRGFRRRAARWSELDAFARRVHASLDLRRVAYEMANEGRRLIGCDRVSVLLRRGSKCRAVAASGVDTVNRRSNVVRNLEKLAAAAVAVDEPIRHPDAGMPLPPEMQAPLDAYLDESHARSLAALPLRPPRDEDEPDEANPRAKSKPLGALVVESFYGDLDEPSREAIAAVRAHGAAALANAMELDRIPLGKLLRTVGRTGWLVSGGRLPKTVAVLLLVAAAVTALVVVPADFTVETRGKLQPLVRREVFAPSDGVVTDVRVEHAEPVAAGDVLVVLRNPELDFEFKRITGELETARKKLASIEAERLENPRETEDQRRRHHQLTAEEEELRLTIGSLEEQYGVLQAQQAELEVRSPLPGEVLTWDLDQRLSARPVGRGDALVTVADVSGPWGLELRLPGDRVGDVLGAKKELGPDLRVSFVLATDPGVRRMGRLDRVAARVEVDDSGEAFVPVTVSVDRGQVPQRVPGADVVAKIHCGRRAVGYVWLHDLIEAVQTWVLF